MNKWKEIRYVTLFLMMFCLFLGWNEKTYAATEKDHVLLGRIRDHEVDNPLYDTDGTGDVSAGPFGAFHDLTGEIDENYDADQIREIAVDMRENLVLRNETFTIHYRTDEKVANVESLVAALFDAAVVHTGVPVEGDYLRWHYRSYKYGGNITGIYQLDEDGNKVLDDNGNPIFKNYVYNLDWTMEYYTDADMEEEMNQLVSDLLASLPFAKGSVSDPSDLKVIYDYVCAHVKYDHKNKNNVFYNTKYTAYAALKNGMAVCQGYASLLYRLLLERGIDCRLIAGTGGGEAHGWNIVKVDDLYYNVDATWDAGKDEKDYYLCYESSFPRHERYDDYRTSEFYEAYPMACQHVYEPALIQKPTCDQEGCLLYSCIYEYCSDSYVEYIPATHTVLYHANGGSGSMKDQKVICQAGQEKTQILNKNSFKRTGYSFKGWYAKRDSDGKWYAAKKDGSKNWYTKSEIKEKGYLYVSFADKANIRKLILDDGEQLHLYAQWKANTYKVYYKANGGSGSMSSQSFTYKVKKALKTNKFKRKGKKFAGWRVYRKSDGKWLTTKGWFSKSQISKKHYSYKILKNKATITDLSSVKNDKVYLYAYWKKK